MGRTKKYPEIDNITLDDIVIDGETLKADKSFLCYNGHVVVPEKVLDDLEAYPDHKYEQLFGDKPSLPFNMYDDNSVMMKLCVAGRTTAMLSTYAEPDFVEQITEKVESFAEESIKKYNDGKIHAADRLRDAVMEHTGATEKEAKIALAAANLASPMKINTTAKVIDGVDNLYDKVDKSTRDNPAVKKINEAMNKGMKFLDDSASGTLDKGFESEVK